MLRHYFLVPCIFVYICLFRKYKGRKKIFFAHKLTNRLKKNVKKFIFFIKVFRRCFMPNCPSVDCLPVYPSHYGLYLRNNIFP